MATLPPWNTSDDDSSRFLTTSMLTGAYTPNKRRGRRRRQSHLGDVDEMRPSSSPSKTKGHNSTQRANSVVLAKSVKKSVSKQGSSAESVARPYTANSIHASTAPEGKQRPKRYFSNYLDAASGHTYKVSEVDHHVLTNRNLESSPSAPAPAAVRRFVRDPSRRLVNAPHRMRLRLELIAACIVFQNNIFSGIARTQASSRIWCAVKCMPRQPRRSSR